MALPGCLSSQGERLFYIIAPMCACSGGEVVLALRLDPWGSEYDTAVQLVERETPARVDLAPETDRWEPRRVRELPRPEAVAFIDGRQRVEVRVLDEQREQGTFAYGLFGSYGVGAVVAGGERARMEHLTVGRRLVLGGGRPRRAVIPAGNIDLEFKAHAESENTPTAPLQGLQNVRREEEVRLGRALVERAFPLVILDGPLTFFAETQTPVVGLVKTLHRTYLEPAEAALLWELKAEERTPVFAIEEGRFHRYSWYLRLAKRNPVEHGLAGVIRLETLVGVGIEEAVRLADVTARHLPAFATAQAWDPRAPQNLYPVSALESHLAHLMGDPEWIRRSIVTYLAKGGGE